MPGEVLSEANVLSWFAYGIQLAFMDMTRVSMKRIWFLNVTGNLLDESKICRATLVAQMVKNLPAMEETPSSVPGSGRSAGEEVDYPLQHCWASLVPQLVKSLPAVWETWVWSLGWEDPWRREQLPTPVFWRGEFHELFRGVTKSQTWLSDFYFLSQLNGENWKEQIKKEGLSQVGVKKNHSV